MDPRPEISVSPYATFQNNPIWNTDANGDTTRAYSDKTGELIGTTYGEKGNKALVVKANKVEEVRKLLNGNDSKKSDKNLQNMLESQLENGSIFGFEKYGTLYDVGSMFKFYDNNGSKYNATRFSTDVGYLNFSDLKSGTLNGRNINLKSFSPKGAEVEANLILQNGIVTMGLSSNFRTSFSLNSQNLPLPWENNKVSSAHTHPGINFDFRYKTKKAGNNIFNLIVKPNLRPSQSDYNLAGNSGYRLAVISSEVIFLYTNDPYQEIKVDRKIK